jgi:diguanylate cyclase (GGDEF)-like protein
MARQGRDHKPLAVLLIDLDDFKTVNDSLGHAAGDELLVSVAQSIRSCLRPADTAARLGGDEFAVLVEDMRGRRDALNVAERILRAFTGKLVIEGKEVFVHGSVGIAISYGQEESEELLRNADVAMYAAKAKGKSRYEVFDIGMHEGVLARLDLKTELQTAAERREFSLHYQPLVSLANGRIIGAEALLRWNHPIRGFIPPVEFIPLAEETGLILDIGKWVLEEACLQTNYWQMTFDADFKISVNLSGRQLQEADVVEVVGRAISNAPIAPSSLTLEITESILMRDTKTTVAKLGQLRDSGVHLAIDDFGTGYSSLGYLREFPVGVVKIDKSFTDGVAQGPEDSALARAIIKLAETLGMQAIAEGIETDEQVKQLIGLGCATGQGDFFSRAVPSAEFEALLSAQASSGWPGSNIPEPVFPA